MIEFERRGGIVISRSKYESQQFYHDIKDKLIRRTKDFHNETYIYNTFYLEGPKFLVIPRYFPVDNFVQCKIYDGTSKGDDIVITHNITPRNELQKKAINYMLTNDSGVIQLNPGVGKTVISIRVIAERKKKSFILVHRDSLVEQWTKRLLEFTNLKEDDISRLSSKNYKNDLKKPIIISTAQTFVSILKNNRTDFLKVINQSNLGVFIGDEVHTSVGAPTFSECSIHIPTAVNFGLSATPYRYDGNSDIIQFHLGEVFSEDDTGDTMFPNITVLLFDYGVDIPKRYKYLNWGGNFQRSRYLNLIKKSDSFMTISKALLDKFKIDNNVLFVSERIKLIDELYDWIDCDSKSKFIASSKNDVLEEKVTFSTPGKIRDGVDASWKDTLIMTSPISNIAQICGRVIRSSKDKDTPIIIDMVDIGCKRISGTFYKRLDYYEGKRWKIQYVFIDNNLNKHIVEKEEALNIIKGI